MKIVDTEWVSLNLTKVASVIFCFFILVVAIYLSAKANFDLSDGRFALFMDERITFDGVKFILHPNGFSSFIDSIVGVDQRYGRSLWVSMAAFSFIPEWIWGESGQIVAGRMLQVLLILSTWFIFAFGVLRNWYLRILLLVALLGMPYSYYYLSMPKPEPLQIFFILFFCFFYFRAQLKFGWYWVFAGLAFGTKISTLPAIIIFLFAAFFMYLKNRQYSDFWQSFKIASIYFFIGLSIAVPILFKPVLLGIVGCFLYITLKRKFRIPFIFKALSISVYSALLYIASRNEIDTWLSYTFQNTKHGADQASINAWSWIYYYFNSWLIVPNLIGILFISAVMLFIFSFIFNYLRKKAISPNSLVAISIALSGIALNFSIFFGAQRLWGFYLYPGSILMVAGLILMIDLCFYECNEDSYPLMNSFLSIFGCSLAICLFCISSLAWVPHTINNLEELAVRTKFENYKQQYLSYQQVLKFLDNQVNTGNKMLKVMFTPSLFPPEGGSKYKIVEFWGPYIHWDESPDVIIFGPINTPRGKPTPTDSPEYSNFLLEREGYFKHVAESGGDCKAKPCFERMQFLVNGGEILVLKK